MKLRFYHQSGLSDCGPACLKMIALYHGRNISIETLRNLSGISKEGVNMLGIAEAAEQTGFKAMGTRITPEQLVTKGKFPCIIYWNQNHFVVLVKKTGRKYIVADPAKGVLKLTEEEFLAGWLFTGGSTPLTKGIALFLEPGPRFMALPDDTEKKTGWKVLFYYLHGYRKYIVQILLGLLVTSLLQLFFPVFTRLMVDNGIEQGNLGFIYVIIIAQFVLMFSRTLVEFLRSRLMLFISTRINLTILSDFWIKMMRLPLSYFDTRMSGDVMQRIGDQKRIENFLTSTTLNIIFSVVSLFFFSILFLLFNWKIYLIFLATSILYLGWIRFFLKARRKLDFERFDTGAKENAATIEMIQGMQDIKLYKAEDHFRWKWEEVQVQAFRQSLKGLKLSQAQETGALLINEGRNILITLLAATAVVNNEMSLGTMVAMQYILGQVSSPVEQIVNFTQSAQDAGISLERFGEINSVADEEDPKAGYQEISDGGNDIFISNLVFHYPGAGNEPVLRNFSLHIPANKVTAIVGPSGAGKTTLLKILLKFYQQYDGHIFIGPDKIPFENLSPGKWRSRCGSVLQDSYIFSETIRNNIAIGDETPDEKRLHDACRIANILEYIQSLPLQFDTKLGMEGNGLSGGQRQRILIARAVYQDPSYLFFDEATNSLDANNESAILEHLQSFFKKRTVVVVAHRLSTVKNADHIIVIGDGDVAEAGDHNTLMAKKGAYYELVKKQTDSGSGISPS